MNYFGKFFSRKLLFSLDLLVSRFLHFVRFPSNRCALRCFLLRRFGALWGTAARQEIVFLALLFLQRRVSEQLAFLPLD